MAESIGKRLRRLRQAKGLSQRDLEDTGISYPYISRVEAGERNPSVHAIRKLAEKLDVTPHYLEFGKDETVSLVYLGPTLMSQAHVVAALHNEVHAVGLMNWLIEHGHQSYMDTVKVDVGVEEVMERYSRNEREDPVALDGDPS